MKLNILAYPNSLLYFFLSSMQEAAGEAIFPYNFFKIAQLYLEIC
jgi:hypothetical protein